MEDKQTRLMLILAAILVALVLFIRFVDAPTEKPEGSEDLVDLMEVQPDQVAKLSLETAEGTLEAERTVEGWILTKPAAARGNDDKLDQLVGMVDRLQAPPPIAGADKAKYGLDEPRAVLTLTLADGTSHTLALGAVAPVGFKTYVSLDGGDVQVASGDPGASATAPFSAFRDNTVVRFAESAVTALRFTGANGAWSATRRDGAWWLEDGRRADDRVLQRAISAARALRFEAFFPELSPSEAQVDPPLSTFTIVDDQGEIVLKLGGERAGGTLLLNPDGVLGTVGSVEELNLAMGQSLEARLLPLVPMDLSRLVVELDGKRVEWTREDQDWKRDGAIDPKGAEVVINTVLDANADRAARPAELGGVTGRIEAEAGEQKVVVVIGADAEGGRVAKDEVGGPLYVVPAETITALAALPGAG